MDRIKERLLLSCTAHYSYTYYETERSDYGYFKQPVTEKQYVDKTFVVEISYKNDSEFKELLDELFACYFDDDNYEHTEYEILIRKSFEDSVLESYAEIINIID